MAVFNAASEIIDAFMKGVELRRQKEMLDLQREKLRIEDKRAEAYEKAQEQAVKTQQGKTRASVLDMISKGILNVPKVPVETTQPFFAPRVGLELPPEVTKEKLAEPYDFGGTLEKPITPEEVTFPTEYEKTLEQFSRAKAAPQVELGRENIQARKEIALQNYYAKLYEIDQRGANVQALLDARMQMDEKNLAARMKMHDDLMKWRYSQLEVARMKAGQSGEDAKKSIMSKIDGIVKDTNQSFLARNFQAATAAYHYATSIPDPSKMTGMEDLSLIYNWIRAQDSTAVREGEIRLTEEAISWLNKAKIKFKRVGTGVILPDESRRQIINDIKKQYNLKFNAVIPLIQAAYNRAKQYDPQLSQEDFKRNFMLYFIMNEKTIDASRVDFSGIDLENPVRNDMTPVVLIPKTGGK